MAAKDLVMTDIHLRQVLGRGWGRAERQGALLQKKW
jgi:hypothetical protein